METSFDSNDDVPEGYMTEDRHKEIVSQLIARLEAHQRLWWARKQDSTHMNSDEFREAMLREYEATKALLLELGEAQ